MKYTALTLIGAVSVGALVCLSSGRADQVCHPTPRMPEAESQAIKRSMLPPGSQMSDFELDHIVPLCLGGSNDRSNLQLQRWPEAKAKDEYEALICYAVCDRHAMPLDKAQTLFRMYFGGQKP